MKPGRNEPCPCGSGKKFKRCCGNLAEPLRPTPSAVPPQIPVKIDAAVQMAKQHYQAERLRQAELICRQVLKANPRHPEALHLLGAIALRAGKGAAAVELIAKAIALDPTVAVFHLNYGAALELQRDLDGAEASLNQALRLKPDLAQAHYVLGNVRLARGQLKEAIESYKQALVLKPDFGKAQYNLIRTQMLICDWSELDKARDMLITPVLEAAGKSVGNPPNPTGVIMLPVPVTPEEQQVIARTFVRERVEPIVATVRDKLDFKHSPGPRKRLRIGYISSDFRNHPMGQLTRGLYKRHDRHDFEIFGYSIGPDDGSICRQRIQKDCDYFRDFYTIDPIETARKIYQDNIDILVDLNGYTRGNRIETIALRPAPVQVNYMGHPGTLGADFVDYIVTDRIITPPEMQPYYDERFVYLPHSYQVNDFDRTTDTNTPSRSDCGLPENAFVFCCFNNSYKIEPMILDVWIRILKQIEGSVLWLVGTSGAIVDNLKREAEARGLAKNRLVFANHLPLEEHLARHRQADLFLDTYYYNAHTTASDALWAGLPVLTCPGATFASRVATSLLHAIGLPELSVSDFDAYEKTAIHLANHPEELQDLKTRLRNNRLTLPLFDTARFTRNLEQAYRIMWDIYASGEPPRQIEVQEHGN